MNKPQKDSGLLIATVDFLPNIGGASMMAHHLANGFADSGVSTRVLAPGNATIPEGFEARYELEADVDAKPNVRFGPDWRSTEAARLHALFRGLLKKQPFERVLLVHPFYYGPALVDFCREHQISISATFLGFELRSQLMFRTRVASLLDNLKGNGPTLRDLTMHVAINATEVLAISEYTSNLVRQTRSKAPIDNIGCGIAIEDYHEQVACYPQYDRYQKYRTKLDLGIPVDKVVIGTMCRLVPSKNVEMLIRTIAASNNFHGVIIGTGPEHQRLEKLSIELGISDRISWVERVTEEEKWSYLAALDVFCLLSKEMDNGQVEGFGIVLLEAACVGTPVVAADSGGMTDPVTPAVSGQRVPVGDIESLVRAINRYTLDPSFASRMVEGARAQIANKFNWQAISTRLVKRWKIQSCSSDS